MKYSLQKVDNRGHSPAFRKQLDLPALSDFNVAQHALPFSGGRTPFLVSLLFWTKIPVHPTVCIIRFHLDHLHKLVFIRSDLQAHT